MTIRSEPSDGDQPRAVPPVTRWDAADVDELRRHDMLLRLDASIYSTLLHDGGTDDEIACVRQCLRGHVTAMRRHAAAASRVTVPAEWRA